jgi:hypothetical protein
MSGIFPNFFVRDEESPEYTACMAIYIFRGLLEVELIAAYPADETNCLKNIQFNIPKWYKHDAQTVGVTRHCLYSGFRYTGHNGNSKSKKLVVKEVLTEGICKDCKDIPDLQAIRDKVLAVINKYCLKLYRSNRRDKNRNSTRR